MLKRMKMSMKYGDVESEADECTEMMRARRTGKGMIKDFVILLDFVDC